MPFERRVFLRLLFALAVIGHCFAASNDCLCNDGEYLNTTCLAFCPDHCKSYCQQTFQTSAQDQILDRLDAHLTLETSSIRVVVQLAPGIFEDLSPLRLKKCAFYNSPVTINEYGKINVKNEHWIAVTEGDNLHREKRNEFAFSVNNLNRLYAGKVQCEFTNALIVDTPVHLLTTFSQGRIPTPRRLIHFFATKIYGLSKDVNHVTLKWSPVSDWPTSPQKYHAQCRQVEKSCKKCLQDFRSCKKCSVQGGYVIDKIVDWFRTYVIAEVTRPLEFFHKNNLQLICAVRAIGLTTKSAWSRPVRIEFTVNPAPLLVMSQAEDKGRNVKWYMVNMMSTDAEKGVFSVRWESTIKQKFFAMDAECCSGVSRYQPEVIGLVMQNPFQVGSSGLSKVERDNPLPLSFCLNWLAGTHYEAVAGCDKLNKDLFCVVEFDDTGAMPERLIYKAKAGQRISQVVCNPYQDFVAFSMENSHSEDSEPHLEIMISFLTRLETYSIVPDKDYTNYPWDRTRPLPIASPAITLDWTDGRGLIVFLTKTKGNRLSLHKYNPMLRTFDHFSGSVQLENDDVIRKIGIDWSHFYLLRGNKRSSISDVQFYKWHGPGELDTSKAFNLKTMVAENFNGRKDAESLQILGETSNALLNISAEQVIDILPIAGEMRKILPAPEYYPDIKIRSNKSISSSALEINLWFKHKSPLYSLRPVFKVIVTYKEHDPKDNRSCKESNNCKEVRSGMNIGRLESSESFVIGSLDNHRDYYVELKIQPLRARIYYQDNKNHTIGMVFKHNYYPEPLAVGYILLMVLLPLAVLVVCLSIWVPWYMSRPERKLRNLDRIPNRLLREKDTRLGVGNTSEVFIAKHVTSGQIVVVKRPKDRASKEEIARLLQEGFILQHCNHDNIIKPIGIVFDTKPFKLVLEYFPHGSLLNYLHKERTIPLLIKIQIGIDIAKAGVYLHQKEFIHRDISAKNVLVRLGKGRMFMKCVLADFGLAKDQGDQEYYNTTMPQFPILHGAPEAFSGRFTIQSDVFSFGTLLWEIFTGGETPFSEVFDLTEINMEDGVPFRDLGYLICHQGYRPASVPGSGTPGTPGTMVQPEGCPDRIWSLILDCWKKVPSQRPIFSEVLARLEHEKSIAKTLAPQEISFFPDLLQRFHSGPAPCCSSDSETSEENIHLVHVDAYSRDDLHKQDGEDETEICGVLSQNPYHV